MDVVKWIVLALGLQLAAPYAYAFVRHDLTVCTGVTLDRPYTPLFNVRGVRGRGAVRFVPLDDFPETAVQALADYYRAKYDLAVEVVPPLPVPSVALDSERGQFNADALIDVLRVAHPQRAAEPLVVIGLLAEDMYIPAYNWRFALGYRRDERYAVVSSFQMDYGCLGFVHAAPPRVHTRMRKMVTKNVGILYYGLPLSNDPRSVLYGNVGGVQELDRMTEEF